jgi:CRISPR-associated protein Csm4
MRSLRFVLRPLTAFGTPLVGDTLFGHLCWTLRRLHGEARLTELLEGYAADRSFAVLSDAFPHDFLPLPTLPSSFWHLPEDNDRKKRRARHYLPLRDLDQPLTQWQTLASDDEGAKAVRTKAMQPHNTINRMTGTTGTDQFAPYVMPQLWYAPDVLLDVYAVLDETRLDRDAFLDALKNLGQTGYGRDAGIGLGKFEITDRPDAPAWPQEAVESYLTLAPCAPQGLGYDADHSWYQTTTRFGRHGDVAALGENPFKQPLLMAKTGAVFTLKEKAQKQFLGQGLTGVSCADSRTVHQGYAPVVPLPALPKNL